MLTYKILTGALAISIGVGLATTSPKVASAEEVPSSPGGATTTVPATNQWADWPSLTGGADPALAKEALAGWVDELNESERSLAAAQRAAASAVLGSQSWLAQDGVETWQEAIRRHLSVFPPGGAECAWSYARVYSDAVGGLNAMADEVSMGISYSGIYDPAGIYDPGGIKVRPISGRGPREAMRRAERIFDTGAAGLHDAHALWSAICEPHVVDQGLPPAFDIASRRGALAFGKPRAFPDNEYIALATNSGDVALAYEAVLTRGKSGSRKGLKPMWGYEVIHPGGQMQIIWFLDTRLNGKTKVPKSARLDARGMEPTRPRQERLAGLVTLGEPRVYWSSVPAIVVPMYNSADSNLDVLVDVVGTRAGDPVLFGRGREVVDAKQFGLLVTRAYTRTSGGGADSLYAVLDEVDARRD